LLNALMAFAAEHQRCGDLDGGVDKGLIMRPEKEPPHSTAKPVKE